MYAETFGSTTLGINGILIHVEVDIANGLPGFDIVGLPDTAVRESRERVRAAIKNAGFVLPAKKVIVNLAPADIKKDSSGLDLAIAVAVLAASGLVPAAGCRRMMFAAELSLEGKLRPISGLLPMAVNCRQQDVKVLMTAPENAGEALLVDGLTVYAPPSLGEVIAFLRGEAQLTPPERGVVDGERGASDDFADVKGQFAAKRALEIAAAGAHNIIMTGAPGSGKTLLAKCVRTILPTMSPQESLEVTKIYSVAGMLKGRAALITERPFRNPHHTISGAGMVGGGTIPRPGEVTLSHNGVLFLDELPEFSRTALEVLRQPLEDCETTISRVNAVLTYPARFMLVAAQNPCPCGWLLDADRQCSCSEYDIRRYRRRLSGPLLDRIDIHISVARVAYEELTAAGTAESSAAIRRRVEAAREIQRLRLARYGMNCNAQMNRRALRETCQLNTAAESLLEQAFKKLNMSARGYDRIIKVARTIADLSGTAAIDAVHVAEAVQLRGDVSQTG